MILASISDIHIHEIGDPGWKAFDSFRKNPIVERASHIGLLGDIFDLMAGDHPEYLERHNQFFETIKEWCESGKIVFYAEGNHDMHLSMLRKRLTKSWSTSTAANFIILRNDSLFNLGEYNIQLGHGDKYNQEDKSYLRYIKFITHPALGLVANHFMPYQVLKYFGERASIRSRKYGYNKFDEDKVRAKFRLGVEGLTPKEAKFVIGGHSHVVDEHVWDNKKYLNNGYPPKSGKFVVIDSNGAILADL